MRFTASRAWFLIIAALVFSGVLVAVALHTERTGEGEATSPASSVVSEGAASELRSSGQSDSTTAEVAVSSSTERRAVDDALEHLLLLRVLTEEGVPVEGAVVSLSARESSQGVFDSEEERLLALLENSSWAETDPDGRAQLHSEGGRIGRRGSVLWVTHPELRAMSKTLDSESGDWNEMIVVRLAEGVPLEVHVDGRGSATSGGTRVLQSGMSTAEVRVLDRENSWLHGVEDGDAVNTAELRCFVRSYQYEEGERLLVARGPSPSRLVAMSDGMRSIPRVSRPDEELVRLALVGQLVAGGAVNKATSVEIPEDARVECEWQGEVEALVVGEIAVEGNGAWGPVNLPWRTRGKFVFRLLGGDLVPREVFVDVATAHSPLRVDFNATIGATQIVTVEDPEGAPVQGARVEAIWPLGNEWLRSRAWTGADGHAALRGCPNTTAWIRIVKSGFVRVSQSGINIVQPTPEEFVLERAGTVSGRVTHAGEPVENFKVFSWSTSPVERDVQTFSGRSDGNFVLDGVRLGQLTLVASSVEFPESEAVLVEVSTGEQSRVELDLPDGAIGVGRVIDAATGDPIVGATVELVAQFSGRPLGTRGAEVHVASNGGFEVEGVPRGASLIKARAPGRVPVSTGGLLGSDGKVEFGVIPLSARQDLQVRVHSPRPLTGGEVWFGTNGAFGVPVIHIPASGELLVPDVAPGQHMAMLMFENGTTIAQEIRLKPGTDWLVEFDYHPDSFLDVLIVPGEDIPLPPVADLQAQYRSSAGALMTRSIPADTTTEPTRLDHIPSGDVILFVTGNAWLNRLGSKQLHLGDDRSEVVELHLGIRRLEITAVDQHGDLLDQGVVVLNSTRAEDPFTEGASMPGGAPLVMDGVPVDEVLVTVRHPSLGLGYEVVRMEPGGTTTVEVEVGGPPMNVRVIDANGGVPGVEVRQFPADVQTIGFHGKTGDDGTWTFAGTPPRKYSLALDRYGYWPERHEVEFDGQELLTLSIRQRGDLQFTAKTTAGLKIVGQEIILRSVLDDTLVGDWVARGVLAAEAVRLVTDEEGTGLVHGIPSGAYDWRLERPDGSVHNGTCVVSGGEQESVYIVVPD